MCVCLFLPCGYLLGKAGLKPVQGGASFVDHLCYFCLAFVMHLCATFYCCLVVTCWERADLLALVSDV